MKQRRTHNTEHLARHQPPIRVALAIDIRATREATFDYLADLENNSRWNWAVKATTPLRPGSPHQGAQYLQQRAAPRTGTDLLQISRYEPPRLLEVTGLVDEGTVRYRYELTSISPRQTRLDANVGLRPVGELLHRTDLYTARLREAVAGNLESLRSAIADADLLSSAPSVT